MNEDSSLDEVPSQGSAPHAPDPSATCLAPSTSTSSPSSGPAQPPPKQSSQPHSSSSSGIRPYKRWTTHEEDELYRLGAGSLSGQDLWGAMAAALPGRTSRACKDRYTALGPPRPASSSSSVASGSVPSVSSLQSSPTHSAPPNGPSAAHSSSIVGQVQQTSGHMTRWTSKEIEEFDKHTRGKSETQIDFEILASNVNKTERQAHHRWKVLNRTDSERKREGFLVTDWRGERDKTLYAMLKAGAWPLTHTGLDKLCEAFPMYGRAEVRARAKSLVKLSGEDWGEAEARVAE